MEIRALRTTDERGGFHSGDEALDRFFRHYAGQNQFRHHLGVTYIAIEADQILGFVTVSPRHIEIEDLPEKARAKIPRYPIPVLGIARLAVDSSARSKGVGAQLLKYAFQLALRMSEDLGCAGVVVDADCGAPEMDMTRES